MTLRILIVHDFNSTKRIVRNNILTEHQDTTVDMAVTPHDAVKMLRTEKYDIVFCGLEMASMDGISVYQQMLAAEINKNTAFVIMTSSFSESQQNRLNQYGIKYVLPLPFTPLHLRNLIQKIFDPRQQRLHDRFSISDLKAVVHTNESLLPVDVINLGMNGILCELDYDDHNANLLNPVRITLLFPDDFGKKTASGINGCAIRIQAKNWDTDYYPKRIRIAWMFVDVPKESKDILTEALAKAKSDLQEAEEDVKRLASGPKY